MVTAAEIVAECEEPVFEPSEQLITDEDGEVALGTIELVAADAYLSEEVPFPAAEGSESDVSEPSDTETISEDHEATSILGRGVADSTFLDEEVPFPSED